MIWETFKLLYLGSYTRDLTAVNTKVNEMSMSRCWPRPMLPYGITRPQWVNVNPLWSTGLVTLRASSVLVITGSSNGASSYSLTVVNTMYHLQFPHILHIIDGTIERSMYRICKWFHIITENYVNRYQPCCLGLDKLNFSKTKIPRDSPHLKEYMLALWSVKCMLGDDLAWSDIIVLNLDLVRVCINSSPPSATYMHQ